MKLIKAWKKTAAVLLAACLLTACGGSSDDDNIIHEKDLPYGATLVEDKTTYSIPVEYDRRFVPVKALETAVRYYQTIQDRDAAAFEALQFPLWHDYYLKDVLGGEFTDAAILENTCKELDEYVGGEFAFSQIAVTGFITDNVNEVTQNTVALMDKMAEEKGKTKVSEGITEFYEMTITRYLTTKAAAVKGPTAKFIENELLYVFCHDGQWYVIYT